MTDIEPEVSVTLGLLEVDDLVGVAPVDEPVLVLEGVAVVSQSVVVARTVEVRVCTTPVVTVTIPFPSEELETILVETAIAPSLPLEATMVALGQASMSSTKVLEKRK